MWSERETWSPLSLRQMVYLSDPGAAASQGKVSFWSRTSSTFIESRNQFFEGPCGRAGKGSVPFPKETAQEGMVSLIRDILLSCISSWSRCCKGPKRFIWNPVSLKVWEDGVWLLWEKWIEKTSEGGARCMRIFPAERGSVTEWCTFSPIYPKKQEVQACHLASDPVLPRGQAQTALCITLWWM